MEIIAEFVNRSGKVLSFTKVSGNVITIGRAYDNDIIIQEEHVSPYHAELRCSETGEIELVDLDSVNGVLTKSNHRITHSTSVDSGEVYVFGKQLLRFVRPNHEVSPAKKLNFLEELTYALNNWALALVMVFAYWGLIVASGYFQSTKEYIWSKAFVGSILMTLGIMLIPLFISLLARIFKKEVRLFAIITLFFSLAIIQFILGYVGDVIHFNYGFGGLVELGETIIDYGCLLLFLMGSFYLASNLSVKKIMAISCGLVVSFAVLFHLHNRGDDTVKLFPTVKTKILSSHWLWVTPKTIEESIQNSQSLFTRATKEAQERNEKADNEK